MGEGKRPARVTSARGTGMDLEMTPYIALEDLWI